MYILDWSKYLSTQRDRNSMRDLKGDSRNDFESDRGRAIFSSAIRRMHDKAQVMPLTSGDSMHTRLTHSLEVMSIASSLGSNLCRSKEFIDAYGIEKCWELEREIPKILETAALLHDIGNPPFGHFGESIIQKFFKDYFEREKVDLSEEQKTDFLEFDGNAQGFRIITKLQHIGDLNGLNLTFATLGAYVKYPNVGKSIKGSYNGEKKHGVFTSEKNVFEKLVNSCQLRVENRIKRHPLSFLVEAADSISYNIMDAEDGLNKGWYSFDDIITYIDDYTKQQTGKDFSCVDFFSLSDSIETAGSSVDKSDKRKMIDFRIKVIRYYVTLATTNFIKNLEQIENGTYSKELIEDDPNYISLAFQDFAKRYIFPQKEIQQVELTGVTVISGLLNYLIDYVFNTDKQYRKRAKSLLAKTCLTVASHETAPHSPEYFFLTNDQFYEFDLKTLDTYHKLRMIVDFVSGMTDKYALNLYRQLSGQVL